MNSAARLRVELPPAPCRLLDSEPQINAVKLLLQRGLRVPMTHFGVDPEEGGFHVHPVSAFSGSPPPTLDLLKKRHAARFPAPFETMYLHSSIAGRLQ